MATYVKRGKVWHVQYFDHTGRRRTKSTKTSDKKAAERIGNKYEAEAALRRERVIDPRLERIYEQAAKPLAGHLDAFGDAMRSRAGAAHIKATRKFCDAVAEFNDWKLLRDVEPDGANRFIVAMFDSGSSARTVASYVQAAKSFTKWAVKSGRLSSDPLATVTKPSTDGDPRVVRRYLSQDEYRWLDATCRQSCTAWGMSGQERALLYALAIQTGLRSAELRSLTRGKLHLAANPPFVTVEAKRTKNSKPARQYIQPELAAELRSHSATKLAGAAVFNMPAREDVAEMLRDDMALARERWLATSQAGQERIEADASDFLRPLDSEGATLDFHALRHTCASWLIQAGADVKTVQAVMRHSDIKLTLDRYGHLYPGSEAAAVAMVRDAFLAPHAAKATGTDEKALHICGQSACETVQNCATSCETLGPAVAMATGEKTNKNQGKTPVSQGEMQVRVLGLEPRTHGLKVRGEVAANTTADTTCENHPSPALHICGQSGCENKCGLMLIPAAARPRAQRLLELFQRMTAQEQLAELDRWEQLYG